MVFCSEFSPGQSSCNVNVHEPTVAVLENSTYVCDPCLPSKSHFLSLMK